MKEKTLKILDIPKSERPQEKLISQGASVLTNTELLALILRTGVKGENVINLSQRIINELNGLDGILTASLEDIKSIRGIKNSKGSQILALAELVKRIKTLKTKELNPRISNPKELAKLLYPEMSCLNQEILKLIVLNTKNEIVKTKDVFKGGLNSSLVHPREIFNEAIKSSAASIIISHNHPSGDPTPSKEDIAITKRLSDCGKLLGINLTDHIIIGNNKYVSLREKGII
ncbi:DNA repair protein RadC [Clostridium thermobutyricum]|uniref:RadC family protein n=1 Tax=Clostridium thermobutyricum TaxID=29372 RepID=UPI002941EF69|nr:DNA repair protein RadC [Clostridium thermobutyricum]